MSYELSEFAKRIETSTGEGLGNFIITALVMMFPEPDSGYQPRATPMFAPEWEKWNTRNCRVRNLVQFGAYVEAALALIPDGWSISFGEKRGLPEHIRMFAWLNDHNTKDGLARRHVEASASSIGGAVTAAAIYAFDAQQALNTSTEPIE